MATAIELLRDKGHMVFGLGPEATVLDAARLMNDAHVGSVLVIDKGRLVGIFTERDVLRRVVAEQRDPGTTHLEAVMTTAVACATPQTRVDEIRRLMRDKRIRHVPVVDGGHILGLVSIGDLNRVDQETQEQTILYLEQYMYSP